MKMAESYPNRQKTLWEKEKLLVTSNFSFSHSVFKRLVSQGRQKVSLCGNGLRGNLSFTHRFIKRLLLQTSKNQGLFGKELKPEDKIYCIFSKRQKFTKLKAVADNILTQMMTSVYDSGETKVIL